MSNLFTCWDNNKTLEELFEQITSKFNRQQQENDRLRAENEKLKNGIWEKEEVKNLKERYDVMKKEYYRGFPISQEEYDKIQEWAKATFPEYGKTKIGLSGALYHYEFQPTPLGESGVVVNNLTGEKFQFREIG